MSVGVYGIYALTNAWFVARGVGTEAMAAVNLAAPVLLVLGAVATTVGVGGASLVSRRLGAGDPAGAARAAGNALALFWLTAAALGIVGLVAIEPLLTLLGATGDARADTRAYVVVLLCGTLVATGFSSLVRAEGRMRYATMIWVVAVLVQITLDPILIFGFGLGVRGAALGTVGGQTVSAGMALWFFFGRNRRAYDIGWRDLIPHGPTLRALVGIGTPSFLAGFGATLLGVLVNNLLAGAAGTLALAAYAVSARIQTFVMMPQLGISQGVQPIVGYNVGRRLHDRVRRARVLALRASLGYGALAALSLILFSGPLVAVFVDDPAIAGPTEHALRVIAVGVAVAGIPPLVSAYFQALGRTAPSYLISVGTLVLIKAPLVVAFSHAGVTAIWTGLAAGEAVSALVALLVLRRVRAGDPVTTIRRPVVDG
ncbi:MATE family efflux transporter [Polymorphospora rubra]|uniref:MATE family efflux transporter n=1 Tax=Polymorphospora rubra TaxID=338584 RepID=A0A810ND40_9ACTN|nr:MATE family efflux transporter [Polymorphospora rubra]BCJ69413.1 MATE family efflux transporter [Polymorphospora rubra]